MAVGILLSGGQGGAERNYLGTEVRQQFIVLMLVSQAIIQMDL